MECEKQNFKSAVLLLPLVSWAVAAYFLVGFLDPTKVVNRS